MAQPLHVWGPLFIYNEDYVTFENIQVISYCFFLRLESHGQTDSMRPRCGKPCSFLWFSIDYLWLPGSANCILQSCAANNDDAMDTGYIHYWLHDFAATQPKNRARPRSFQLHYGHISTTQFLQHGTLPKVFCRVTLFFGRNVTLLYVAL